MGMGIKPDVDRSDNSRANIRVDFEQMNNTFLKIDKGLMVKVYTSPRWRDIVKFDIHGTPKDFRIKIVLFKRGRDGRRIKTKNGYATEVKEYRLGKDDV